MNCGSCSQGQKSKLSYRHAELGAVKEKKNLGMFRLALCSLYLLCSQEMEREKLIPLFSLFTETVETKIYLVTESRDSKMQ